jgi:hypothetical protein
VAADVSWWPKHAAWQGSGLNVSYWTPAAENWYQKCLEEIRQGTAVLRNVDWWKKAMKFQWESQWLVSGNEKFACEFLTQDSY